MQKATLPLALTIALVLALAWPSASAPEPVTAEVDPVMSTVFFRIKWLGISNYYGRFNKFSGKITTVEGGVGSCEFTVDASSVDTANEQRDNHLRSPDFFDVKQFPEIQFKSDKVADLGGGKHKAEGSLTMHGVTKPVTIEFMKTGSGKGFRGEMRLGYEGRFTIQRSDFGIAGATPRGCSR